MEGTTNSHGVVLNLQPTPFSHHVEHLSDIEQSARRARRFAVLGVCTVAACAVLVSLSLSAARTASPTSLSASHYAYDQLCDGCIPRLKGLKGSFIPPAPRDAAIGGIRAVYQSANGDEGAGLYSTKPAYYAVRHSVEPIVRPIVHERRNDINYYGGRDELPYVQLPPSRITGDHGHVMWVPNDCKDSDEPCDRRWVWSEQRPHKPLLTTYFPVGEYLPTKTYPYIRGPFKYYLVNNEGNSYNPNKGGHWVWVTDKTPTSNDKKQEGEDTQERYPQSG